MVVADLKFQLAIAKNVLGAQARPRGFFGNLFTILGAKLFIIVISNGMKIRIFF
jgi:hypothetical protein